MGLFLSVSGVLSPDGEAVRKAISSFVAKTGGTFEPRAGTMDDRNIGVMQSTALTTTVLYPDGFLDWDALSGALSIELRVPVFSFHIHDGDFWMFVAFDNGEEVARFNPRPDYWEEVDDSERIRWSGDADLVAGLVPGLVADSISRYLVQWTSENVDFGSKAYDDDEFTFGSDWQLTDFMSRLGFTYPLDSSGNSTGETFYLKIRRQNSTKDSNSPTITNPEPPSPDVPPKQPWWKIW